MKEKIKNTNSLQELQDLYTATFGKSGTMTAKLKNMASLSNEERAVVNAEIQNCVNYSKTNRRN